MSMPTKPGRYFARPNSWSVEETGQNKLLTFVCGFELSHVFEQGEWQAVQDLQIIGYFYLMKKGPPPIPNENAVKSLRAALGWEGGVSHLANGDWTPVEVQLQIDAEEYQGRTRLKVNWINPRDYEGPGTVQKSDPAAVQSLEAKYGAMFRAIGGTVPPVAAAPILPTKEARPNPVPDAKRVSWEAFKAAHPTFGKDVMQELWREALSAFFPGRGAETLGAMQFLEFKNANFVRVPLQSPVSEMPQLEVDDIPF